MTQPAPTTSGAVGLHLEPSPEASFEAARSHREGLAPLAAATREALCLPTHGPVIMTGHQAGAWHAGILAKYLYASALASRLEGGSWAHVVVDQDVNDAGAFNAPAIDATRVTVRLSPQTETIVTGRRPLARITSPEPVGDFTPQVRGAIRSLLESLASHADATSLADQWRLAMDSMLEPWAGRGRSILATRLASSPGFVAIIEAMRASPRACVKAYNDAAERVPRARISPLRARAGGVELPLWRIDPARGERRQVWSDELRDLDAVSLAPRAILLSGFLRLHACDLFIHGTGGGLYDQVTDAWLAAWRPDWKPAPSAVATATLRLPFSQASELPTPEAIAEAWWRVHHATHDPSLLADAQADRRRRSLVESIREARASGREAKPLYAELHRLLASVRASHAPELEALRARAESLEASAARARVVHDRTWPWMLHSSESLASLRDAISRAIDEAIHRTT